MGKIYYSYCKQNGAKLEEMRIGSCLLYLIFVSWQQNNDFFWYPIFIIYNSCLLSIISCYNNSKRIFMNRWNNWGDHIVNSTLLTPEREFFILFRSFCSQNLLYHMVFFSCFCHIKKKKTKTFFWSNSHIFFNWSHNSLSVTPHLITVEKLTVLQIENY